MHLIIIFALIISVNSEIVPGLTDDGKPAEISARRTWQYSEPDDDNKFVSELMCEEMAKTLEDQGFNDALRIYYNSRSSEGNNSKIINNTNIESGEFPHVVALGFLVFKPLRFIYRCSGALIADRWILTAAHCSLNFMENRGIARFGITKLSDRVTKDKILGVIQIVTNPNYKESQMYDDLALMKLARPVIYSDAIKPACLYPRFETSPRLLWAIGWGENSRKEGLDDNLEKVELKLIDTIECSRRYNRTQTIPYGIVPSMLCAGDLSGYWYSDACEGDSGSPLQVYNEKTGLYDVVGITSFGKPCGTSNFPGVYIRVSHYLEWIEAVVWPN